MDVFVAFEFVFCSLLGLFPNYLGVSLKDAVTFSQTPHPSHPIPISGSNLGVFRNDGGDLSQELSFPTQVRRWSGSCVCERERACERGGGARARAHRMRCGV